MVDTYNKVKKISRDVNIIARFIEIFCHNKHTDNMKSPIQPKGRIGEYLKDIPIELCPECNKLLCYAVSKRIICSYDPKPKCKKCPTHCYTRGYRERIREVMRFSGAYLLKRGRFDLAIKYFF